MFKMFSFSTFSTFCIGQVYCSSHDQFIYCDILSWVSGMDGIQKCVPATKIIANQMISRLAAAESAQVILHPSTF